MDSLYSPSWYRVADLRPRVSWQVRFHRHEYRGEVWYVVRNPTNGRVQRLTQAAYALVGLMDGERTTQQVWDTALAVVALGDAGVPREDPAMVRAADWLLGQEVRVRGDWSVRRPELWRWNLPTSPQS